jgi:uncharacterized protein (DUF983 family)
MTTPSDGLSVLDREAEAEAAQRKIVEESERGLTNRCPECGALGSIEEIDGELRCLDCDVSVAEKSRLGGLGR